MNRKSTIKSIYILLISALLVSIYGILQHVGIDKDIWVQDVQSRVFSSLGQPNWLAAWIIALLPISWALALSNKFQKILNTYINSIIWLSLSSLFFLVLLYTGSRSGLLGFLASGLVFWTLLAYKNFKNKELLKKQASKLLLFFISFAILAGVTGTQFTPSVFDLIKGKATEPVNGEKPLVNAPLLEVGGSESGDIRRIVWGGAIEIWKNYPILGTGTETFAFSYYNYRPAEHNLVSEWEYLYNKAHNEYLNFASTTGTLGLASYFILTVSILFLFFKYLSKDNKYALIIIALASGFISILVTNLFGFSVVPVALLFYLFPAMAVALRESGIKNNELRINKLLVGQKLLIVLTIILASYFIILISRYWYADFLYAKGKLESDSENYLKAREILLSTTNLSPSEAIFWDELSQTSTAITQALQEKGDKDLAAKFAESSINESEMAVSLSPANVNLLRNRASMFIKLSSIDQNYLLSARDTLLAATVLAPTDAKIFYNLALSYIRTGENQKAIEVLEKTIDMKKNYRNAWLALALLHIDEGEPEKARTELEFILENLGEDDPFVKQELNELNSLYPSTE